MTRTNYEVLEQALATTRRDLQATGQALSESRAENAHSRPVADAAHAWGAWVDSDSRDLHEGVRLRGAVLAAHRATTPSAVPSSHVIVERAEWERLQAIADAAKTYCGNIGQSGSFVQFEHLDKLLYGTGA